MDNGSRLREAAGEGDERKAIYAIKRGANVNAKSRRSGETPLHLATEKGYKGMAFMLIEEGAMVNAQDGECNTPLHVAAQAASSRLAQLLIDRGAKVDLTNSDGESPLHLASNNGHLDMVRLLVCKGAGTNTQTDSGETPECTMPRTEVLQKSYGC